MSERVADLKWMKRALAEIGVREIPGATENPAIAAYAMAIGQRWVTSEATPWCASYVGAMLEASGITSTRTMHARSYLHWGVPIDKPARGCITILSRGPNPAFGHVGFWIGETAGKVQLLGGNQGDGVNVASFKKSRVLGYRWPAGVPLPDQPQSSPAEAPAAAVRAVKDSWTVTGGLLALLGTVMDQLRDAVQFLVDLAAETAGLSGVQSFIGGLGIDVRAAAFGTAIGGVILLISRRLNAAAKGKIG